MDLTISEDCGNISITVSTAEKLFINLPTTSQHAGPVQRQERSVPGSHHEPFVSYLDAGDRPNDDHIITQAGELIRLDS